MATVVRTVNVPDPTPALPKLSLTVGLPCQADLLAELLTSFSGPAFDATVTSANGSLTIALTRR